MAKAFAARFAADQRGATAVEYGLLAGLIAVLIIAGITAIGTSTSDNFNAVQNGFPSS